MTALPSTEPPEWVTSAGRTPYAAALAAMEAHVAAIRTEGARERVWLVEHDPTYTAGTSARRDDLRDARFPVFNAGRGGQWTYHGPGQRTGYVMLDLQRCHGSVSARDIRAYVGAQFRPGLTPGHADLVASLIEEADYAASLAETLAQVARRVQRESFSPEAKPLVDGVLDLVEGALAAVVPGGSGEAGDEAARGAALLDLRARCLALGESTKPAERVAILALLGSAERAFMLIERLAAERRSVQRIAAPVGRDQELPGGSMVPAE